jgi:hypothetical protein
MVLISDKMECFLQYAEDQILVFIEIVSNPKNKEEERRLANRLVEWEAEPSQAV